MLATILTQATCVVVLAAAVVMIWHLHRELVLGAAREVE